jgi:hypothetical protein
MNRLDPTNVVRTSRILPVGLISQIFKVSPPEAGSQMEGYLFNKGVEYLEKCLVLLYQLKAGNLKITLSGRGFKYQEGLHGQREGPCGGMNGDS